MSRICMKIKKKFLQINGTLQFKKQIMKINLHNENIGGVGVKRTTKEGKKGVKIR